MPLITTIVHHKDGSQTEYEDAIPTYSISSDEWTYHIVDLDFRVKVFDISLNDINKIEVIVGERDERTN